MNRVILIIILSFSLESYACFVPNKAISHSDMKLVDRTESIVLAKVVGQKKGYAYDVFTFQTIENIKGNAPWEFVLNGFSVKHKSYSIVDSDFRGHKSLDWANGVTNSLEDSDCEAYGYFEEGQTYLIFNSKPTHKKAYEQIVEKEDLWLKWVKLLVDESK